jgi:hypothetical protein
MPDIQMPDIQMPDKQQTKDRHETYHLSSTAA